MPERTVAELADQWAALRRAEPGLRIRDAAARLGASEAELVATRVGDGATRLRGPWPDLIAGVGALGPVMALTRNDDAVHERHGTYGALSGGGHVGLILGEDIDLRIFFDRWAHGFAVIEDTAAGPRRSLQFFAADGAAIHKIYATDATDGAAFAALVADRRHDDQSPGVAVAPPGPPPAARPDHAIDAAALRADWAALRDTHDFFPLLRRHGAGREQAFRLAGPAFAEPVPRDAARRMLEGAAAGCVPIMVFVGNAGIIQIHTGPVSNLVATDPWLNVLDPAFNLHLREAAITGAWVVRKPSVDGTITSLELFGHDGALAVSFFGKRKPGAPELAAWRDLAESLVARVTA